VIWKGKRALPIVYATKPEMSGKWAYYCLQIFSWLFAQTLATAGHRSFTECWAAKIFCCFCSAISIQSACNEELKLASREGGQNVSSSQLATQEVHGNSGKMGHE